MAKLVECTSTFANGTEYELFLETQCDRCTRFRNGHCKTFYACEMARFDEKRFPYKDLMDFEKCGGKRCKRFTTEKPKRILHQKQLEGQLVMEI